MPEATRRPAATWIPLGLVLAVGLFVRLVFAGIAPMFLEGDSQSYLLPGWELANGYGFSPELRRAPLYPLFIAASFRLFGQDLNALALAQHAVGLATVGLTFLLARRLFGTAAGFLAGLAVAVSGPQLIYERYLMTEALFGCLLALAALAMVAALRPSVAPSPAKPVCSGHRWRPIVSSPLLPLLAGLAIGPAALTRPVAQAILPLFVLALLLGVPRWRPALKAAGLALLGYGLLVLPWMARNLAAHETPAAAGGLGRSLIARTVKYDSLFDWKRLSETYDGRDDLPARARILLYNKRGQIPNSRSVRPYQDALIRDLGLTQGQSETVMRQIALEAIARRPADYLAGSLRFTGLLLLGSEERLQSHWKQRANKEWAEQWDDRLDFLVKPVSHWPDEDNRDHGSFDDSPKLLAAATLLTELYQPARVAWPLLSLALVGGWFAVRKPSRRPALLLATTALALLALSAFLDGPVPRYRYPLDPLIAVLAAGGVSGAAELLGAGHRWRQRARTRRSRSDDLAVPLSDGDGTPIPSASGTGPG